MKQVRGPIQLVANGVGRWAMTNRKNDCIGPQRGASLEMDKPSSLGVLGNAADLAKKDGKFRRVGGSSRAGKQRVANIFPVPLAGRKSLAATLP